MNNDHHIPHPAAKIFAPIVFGALALLSVGMAFGPAQADQPTSEPQAQHAAHHAAQNVQSPAAPAPRTTY